METVLAITITALLLLTVVSMSLGGDRIAQHRNGPSVADIQARLHAERARPRVRAGRW